MYNNVRNKKLTDNPLLSFTFECRITINYLRYVDIIGYIFALNRKIFLYFLKLFSIYFNALIMLFYITKSFRLKTMTCGFVYFLYLSLDVKYLQFGPK